MKTPKLKLQNRKSKINYLKELARGEQPISGLLQGQYIVFKACENNTTFECEKLNLRLKKNQLDEYIKQHPADFFIIVTRSILSNRKID